MPPHKDAYAWIVEYRSGCPAEAHHILIVNDGRKDVEYAMQRAVQMSGVVINVYADRRHEPDEDNP